MLSRQPRLNPPRTKKRQAVAVPQSWLMTDARLGSAIPHIAAHMPPRSAIIIRPYAMGGHGDAAMLRSIRHVARAKRHLLLLADSQNQPSLWAYDGCHLGRFGSNARRGSGFLSIAVHNPKQAMAARRMRANAVLISPVWPTRSHPEAKPLGLRGLVRLAAMARCPAIALGGVDQPSFILARRHGAHGWAGIDAWMKMM